ncbi:MAG TPA: Ig-like domain-containing protein [Candidatus Thermoplasmatota archaeon]|nr:Ig-like domain-containing protein [Candidatus Thermoplasmatota archaeon]
MSNESIKKVVVSIIAFFFISTAAAPVIQSQLTNRLLSQQVTATETLARVRVPLNIVQPQGTADKSSQQNPPAPLGDTPPTIHLPTSQVTMLVFLNSTISYFRTQLQNVPSGYEVTNGFYTGWCSDYTHYIYTNTAYQTYLYSSYDTNLPPQDYHQNWSKVNYILNHKQGTNWHQIQYAILYILDFGNQGLNATGWAMVNAAVQYGGDYVPHSGDIIAIIGDPGVNVQRQIFELTVPSYTLTTTPDGSGTITKDPDHTYYTYGQVVTLTAAPNPGWSFSYWSGDASGSNPVTTVTMNGNRAVTAHFTQNEYTLSISVIGSGSVTRNPSQGTYHYGDVVQLTATADTGWTFDHWSGDLSGSTNPASLTVTGNMAVTATFTQNEYTLSTSVVGSGSISKNPDHSTYHYGDVVQLTATADAGWTLDHWSGDLSGSTNPASLTITGNTSVIATFVQNEYTLTTSVVGSGSVTKNPDQQTYHYGDVVQLTATADAGWTFSYWSGDLTGSTNPASLTVTGNMAVTATFILTGDLEPPLVEIAKPSDGVYVFDQYILPAKKPIVIQGVTIQVNASDNQSGVKKVQFYVDGILKGNDSTAPYTYNWTDLRSGMRQVKAVAYDNAGNSRAVEISVMKWRFHPILALLLFYVISPLLRNLKNWIHDHMPAQTST